jgi:hypothetical protein
MEKGFKGKIYDGLAQTVENETMVGEMLLITRSSSSTGLAMR